MPRPRIAFTGLVTLAAALGVAGCGGSASSTSTDSSAAASAGQSAVAIQNFHFAPDKANVHVGDKVTWTNQDQAAHTVTGDDHSFDSGNLAGKASFSFTFSSPGTHSYHCHIHQYMTASITVMP